MVAIKKRTRDFYFYTLFGVPYEFMAACTDEDRIILCAHRAYADLSRTISYVRSSTWLEKNKKKQEARDFIDVKASFKKTVKEYLATEIIKLHYCKTRTEFDNWHGGCCAEIKGYANQTKGLLREVFTYGQAQKWVNMTLKYMDISGFWDEANWFVRLRQFMHVPVDSYILKASSGEDIALPRINGTKELYHKDSTKKWSNWGEREYTDFVENLRGKVENLADWEDGHWIETAWDLSSMNPENQKK